MFCRVRRQHLLSNSDKRLIRNKKEVIREGTFAVAKQECSKLRVENKICMDTIKKNKLLCTIIFTKYERGA